MRTFQLVRDVDISGVSGTGPVAEGVEFSDGVVALRWLVPPDQAGHGYPTSVVFHDRGLESVERIHGHNGNTRIVFDGVAAAAQRVKEIPLNRRWCDPDCDYCNGWQACRHAAIAAVLQEAP